MKVGRGIRTADERTGGNLKKTFFTRDLAAIIIDHHSLCRNSRNSFSNNRPTKKNTKIPATIINASGQMRAVRIIPPTYPAS